MNNEQISSRVEQIAARVFDAALAGETPGDLSRLVWVNVTALIRELQQRQPEAASAPLCGVASLLDTKCDLPAGHGGRHRFPKNGGGDHE